MSSPAPVSPWSESSSPAADTGGIGGHPRGLTTLFTTEMWERFSYYGMRALLVLFLADSVRGGFGLDDKTANAIYGLYISASYILCLPGGWIADRLIGSRLGVWYGGILIAAGNALLALGSTPATFYGGLIVVVCGVGLGLPVSRRIVEEHNGWIEAANKPERGVTFTVYLELAEAAPLSAGEQVGKEGITR